MMVWACKGFLAPGHGGGGPQRHRHRHHALPANEWTRGKCGFKGLQYMGCGIPALLSPVGVNVQIIEDGVNGFLAEGEEEWFDKLCRLVEDAGLRGRLGAAGRKTVEERYSVRSQRERYLEVLERALRAGVGSRA
jgi:glycosyltransferase involved in cell wall biosynthesis